MGRKKGKGEAQGKYMQDAVIYLREDLKINLLRRRKRAGEMAQQAKAPADPSLIPATYTVEEN